MTERQCEGGEERKRDSTEELKGRNYGVTRAQSKLSASVISVLCFVVRKKRGKASKSL